jgi:DNA-binding MarR family transcriptional regulator
MDLVSVPGVDGGEQVVVGGHLETPEPVALYLVTLTNYNANRMSTTARDDLAPRLHSAVLHLLRRLAQEDRASGQTPARLAALSVLVFGGPRSIGRLARDERVAPPTMTRLVAGLERDGLVERTPDPDDRRSARLAATDEGRSILLEGRERRIAALSALLATASDGERAALERAADIIDRRLLGRE